jgi:hypothetical protein
MTSGSRRHADRRGVTDMFEDRQANKRGGKRGKHRKSHR